MNKYPNWSPVIDCTLVRPPGTQTDGADSLQMPLRTLLTSGRQPYGALTEIRKGCELQIGQEVEIPQLDNSVNMWTLPVDGGLYILLSSPTFSALLYSTSLDEIGQCDDSVEGIDGSSETLVASVDEASRLIQVTESQVVVLQAEKENTRRVCSRKWPPGVNITKAALHNNVIVVVGRHEHRSDFFELSGARLQSSDSGSVELLLDWPSIALTGSPSCLAILTIHGHQYAFVSIGASLQLYKIDSERGLVLSAKHELPNSEHPQGTMALCESVAAVYDIQSDKTMVLCGLRNGLVFTFRVWVDCRSIVLESRGPLKFGNTPVKLFEDSESLVFALCGSTICRLTPDRHGSLAIASLWFTNHDRQTFIQGIVASIRPIRAANLPNHGTTGIYACILGTSLLFAQITEAVQTVPRRIPIDWTPQRVIYSEHLQKLVVASVKLSIRNFQSHSTRVTRPAVQFVDVDGLTMKVEDPSEAPAPGDFVGKPGERIYSLLDWTCHDNEGRQYHFLVVGTGLKSSKDGPDRGRLQILRVAVNAVTGKVLTKVAKEISMAGPAHSLATCGDAGFICSSGNKITFFRVSFDPPGYVEQYCLFAMPPNTANGAQGREHVD